MSVTTSALLRAALAVSGLSRRELAVHAAISLSRLERLLQGYDAPSLEELHHLFATCGVDAEPLTSRLTHSSIRRRSGRTVITITSNPTKHPNPGDLLLQLRPDEAIVLLRLLRKQDGVRSVSLDECRLSIDKLSIVFNLQPLSVGTLGDSTGVDDEFLKLIKDEGFEPIRAFKPQHHRYRRSFHRSGIHVDHGCCDKDVPSSRISVVPCDVPNQLAWDSLNYIIGLAKRDSVEISEIDIAVDLPVHLHHVQVLPVARLRPNTFTGPGGLEMLYLGSRHSSWQLKTYDKRLEHFKKTGIMLDGPVTRFEITRRDPNVDLDELVNLPNPFRKIGLAFMRGGERDLEDQLLLDYAGLVGVPAIKPRLKPARWRRLATMLADNAGLSCPHPADVFDASWSGVIAQLQRRMPRLRSRP